MTGFEGVFDRSGQLARPSLFRLPHEFASFLFYNPEAPDGASIDGQGHRVMVLPGLMTWDAFTGNLRAHLARCGYRPQGWGQGLNWGPTERIRTGIRDRLDQLCDAEGGPVSVIGVSMGGILARDLAHDRPDHVKRLVSIVSPTHFPTASYAEYLVGVLKPFYSTDIDTERYGDPLAMPALHLFTRDDGLLAWQSCQGCDPASTTVEVEGPHVTICRNPKVLATVAEWLQPANEDPA